MPNRRALVQDDAPSFFQLPDHRPGGVPRRLDDADALGEDGARVGWVVGRRQRRQQRQVDGERLRCERFAFADFGAQRVGTGLRECGDDAEAAGVGDGGGELGVADPLHAALDYGNCGRKSVW